MIELTHFTKEVMSAEFTKYHLNPDGVHPWPFSPVLHHFAGVDRDGPHDHPRSFHSIILQGGYVEEVYTIASAGLWHVERIERRPGEAFRIDARHIHRIVELPAGECVTMTVPGPLESDWRFWKFEDGVIMSRPWNNETFEPYQP